MKNLGNWKFMIWEWMRNYLKSFLKNFQKFLKMKKYDKRWKHMMDPNLDDAIYVLMSKYNLEQFEGAKSIFNDFIQNNKDIGS